MVRFFSDYIFFYLPIFFTIILIDNTKSPVIHFFPLPNYQFEHNHTCKTIALQSMSYKLKIINKFKLTLLFAKAPLFLIVGFCAGEYFLREALPMRCAAAPVYGAPIGDKHHSTHD